MNKLFITLVGVSLTALLLAVGCGSWLFLQSWEEGKRLERQNRELMASLEASRIRLENFCEYPAEALCNLDEQRGSVSGAMSGLSSMGSAASPQNDHAATLPEPSTAIPSMPEPPSAPVSVSTPPVSTEASSEAVSQPQVTTPTTTEERVPDATPLPKPSASAPENTPHNPGQVTLPSKQETTASPSGVVKSKKTWTTLEQHSQSMKLRIAGEGTSLTATGQLKTDPLRYEVTFDGAWNIANKTLTTSLVKEMQKTNRDGNTVLVFLLTEQPGECTVFQEDARTIAIILR